jgi:2-phospho-L-lactate guanylyltransferase
MRSAFLVPVKQFGAAKGRLATRLDREARAHLARWLASGVVAAAGEAPVHVVCDDPDVAAWAESIGCHVLWTPATGLNGAVAAGCDALAAAGFDHVAICHADLPRPGALTTVLEPDTIVLVPDRRRDGTNVVARPLHVALAPSYGPGSFRRHLAAALATGVRVRVSPHPELSLDVDHPDDLDHPLIHPLLRQAAMR